MYSLVKIVVVISVIIVVDARYSSKVLEGYPEGYLSNCPNGTVPITKRDLKYLSLLVHGVRATKRTRYNYLQSHLIAMDPHMDWSRKTAVYIGGFGDSPDFPNAKLMEKYYLKTGYNVMLLDETFFVFTPMFPLVATSAREIGKYLGDMLAIVYQSGVMDPAKIELFGLSLGGQTMGFTAKRFYRLTGRKFGRLSGMDPTGPCYRNAGPDDRLDVNDADFVDVIHSNIDGFGMSARMGHIDFYLNGGEYQLADFNILQYCDSACSHMKAFYTWIASLAVPNSKFIAIRCESIQQARLRQCYENRPMVTNTLGLNVDKTKQGIFYLATYHNFPYFMGEKGLKKENEDYNNMMRTLYKDPKNTYPIIKPFVF